MIEEKTLQKLQFNNILQQVSTFATSESSKNLLLNLKPIGDLHLVKRLLNETSEALGLITKNILPALNFDDVSDVLKKAKILYPLTLKELLAVKRLLRTSRTCVSTLQIAPIETWPSLYEHSIGLYFNKQFEDTLEKSILNEEEIADDASPELFLIRKKIKQATYNIREKLNSFIKSATYTKYLQDSIITVRNDRYVLPVKQEYKGNIQGLIHDQSASGATVFIEPISVVNLNNQLKELILEEKSEIERIILGFTQSISQMADSLYSTQECLAYIDSIYAKAFYAEKINATLPNLNTNGFVSIKKGRHPLLDPKKVVPIEIEFGKTNRLVIITGPNTGGKTVSIKTVGLFCLMTYVGLFIPTNDSTHIAIFDNIFCDIGDEQSIEQNLSTFSSHITNISYILNTLTSKSLVLIDEIGAGTEPIEGAALGLAVSEHLLETNARSIITTHYGKLKEFSITTPNVVSASMEFNTKTFEPTYKLIMGVPGNSNALEIAQKLGLNPQIIKNAYEKVDENKKNFDKILTKAEDLRQQYEQNLQEIEDLKRSTSEENEKLKNQNKLLYQEREKLLLNSKTEAKRIISSAKTEAEELLTQLKQLFKQQSIEENTIFKARSILKKLDEKKYEQTTTSESDIFEGTIIDINTLQMGDKIYIKKLKTVATVTGLPKANKVEVKFNNMVTMLKQGEAYQFIPIQTNEKPRHATAKTTIKTGAFSYEINIIGKTVDEGIYEVEKFIDEALMRGANEVKIIHGRGTGKLKSAVHLYLKSNKSVSEYRIGDFNEGNGGVTIVKFK